MKKYEGYDKQVHIYQRSYVISNTRQLFSCFYCLVTSNSVDVS